MKLLEKLVQTPGIPGREHRIRELIMTECKGLFDEMRTDAMGSLIGVRKAGGKSKKKPVRVMLAAHMDQIGFMVKHIDDAGWIRLNPVGGFDPRTLFCRNVLVHTADGDLPGVLNPGIKPLHISTPEERKQVPELDQFYVDLGIVGEDKSLSKKVQIGDMVTLDVPFQQVGDTVVGRALDNRIGCWQLIQLAKSVKKQNCDLYCVWTVQEEVGLRGAGPAAFGIEPDIAISTDTTICAQVPGVSDDARVTEFGGGVALKMMDGSTIGDYDLICELEALAHKKKIKCQRSVLPRGGQDAAVIQRSRAGVRVAVFAAPVKYIHSGTEMAGWSDIQAYQKLLKAYIQSF